MQRRPNNKRPNLIVQGEEARVFHLGRHKGRNVVVRRQVIPLFPDIIEGKKLRLQIGNLLFPRKIAKVVLGAKAGPQEIVTYHVKATPESVKAVEEYYKKILKAGKRSVDNSKYPDYAPHAAKVERETRGIVGEMAKAGIIVNPRPMNVLFRANNNRPVWFEVDRIEPEKVLAFIKKLPKERQKAVRQKLREWRENEK
ncbi:MAG: hypothetical protein ABID38_06775 [Candidatus Diapherotrites archaeon]